MKKIIVSVVIPCYNEEQTIQQLLSAISSQTYLASQMEVIIVDGLSTDGTRKQINEFLGKNPEFDLHVIENPEKSIPSALNLGIKAAKGEIIVRMDAHSIPSSDYIELCVSALQEGKGDNVGGVIDIRPGRDSWIARSISIATAHPMGVGDARYRWATTAGYADTVAFGTYYRSKAIEIGLYDESLKINEDYEFNSRLRTTGGKIWIDPAIRAVYYSRPDLGSLSKQYFNYGFWKFRMLKRFPSTLKWRQALPPLFVIGLLMLLLLAIFQLFFFWMFLGVLAFYLLALVAGTIKAAFQKKEPVLVLGVPLAIIVMHFSWGSGFWWSCFNHERKGK
jgi:succinoglycan biosynthesis protein ExoA